MKNFLAKITLKQLVIMNVVLNLIDAVSTHVSLRLGFVTELNPLMAWAFSVSPLLFWALKMSLVGSALALLRLFAVDHGRRVMMWANCLYLVIGGLHVLAWVGRLGDSL
jgi:hypothetical protein